MTSCKMKVELAKDKMKGVPVGGKTTTESAGYKMRGPATNKGRMMQFSLLPTTYSLF